MSIRGSFFKWMLSMPKIEPRPESLGSLGRRTSVWLMLILEHLIPRKLPIAQCLSCLRALFDSWRSHAHFSSPLAFSSVAGLVSEYCTNSCRIVRSLPKMDDLSWWWLDGRRGMVGWGRWMPSVCFIQGSICLWGPFLYGQQWADQLSRR